MGMHPETKRRYKEAVMDAIHENTIRKHIDEAVAPLERDNMILAGNNFKLREQRDALVLALKACQKELSSWMRDHGDDIGTQEAVSMARAALEKVDADKTANAKVSGVPTQD